MTATPPLVALLAGLAVASYTDVRDGKIPNWLTGTLIVLGLVTGVIEGTATAALIGLGVAFAIHFPAWALGIEKGGDAKLLMGVGALMGWSFMVETTAWCAILYLPVGLAILAIQGRLANLWLAVQWSLMKAQGKDPGERPAPTTLRTAPIIAVAGVTALLTPWFEFTW